MLPLVGCKNFVLSLVLHTEISNMIKKSISIKFGERVREIRVSKNLSQEQLALVNIEKIANGLNVNITELLK